MLTDEQRACPHTTIEPTGEVRNLGGCKSRNAIVARPVLACTECGTSFVMRGGQQRVVPPSSSFEEVVARIRRGQLNPKVAVAQYGNFTDEQREELKKVTVCAHTPEPFLIVYRCKDCGKLTQERVRQVAVPK